MHTQLAVLGAGPGGYAAAFLAADKGIEATIVESDSRLGGTCLLRGCIPTKALLHTADLYEDLGNRKEFGIVAEGVRIDFGAVMSRKARIVKRLSKGIETYLFKKNKVELFRGHGRLEGARRVVVKGEDGETAVETRNVLIATGSRPRTLPGMEVDGKTILTSDEILELKEMPKSLIVVGAGAVGIEFASIFARFGAEVTVIELLPRVLPLEDEEISAEAKKLLAKQMKILTATRTESVRKTDSGVEVTCRAESGETRTLQAQLLLVAVGRGPVTDGLGLESTKVRIEKGYVQVNPRMETDEPGIFAIGDVVSVDGAPHAQLAHVASHEGIGVAERLAGKGTEPLDYDLVPSATYCSPEVAGVGLTQAEAERRGYDVKVGRFPFANLAKPRIVGHDGGFVKVVSEARYDEVLGIHIIGPHATDLISEACVALRLESTTEEIFRTVHPHPTLPEAIMQAAEAVYGHAIDA